MKHLFGLLISLFFIAAPALAGEAVPTAADPVLEARVQAIASELRCLVCQNQTIADSHAELAVDLRDQVREMVKRGDSQEQIVAYMTARYGDFVLYRPPVRKSTWLLWFGPLLLLVFSVSMLILHLRRRRNQPAELFDPEFPDDEADVSPEKSK
jgi:cytochrome c-type biogenesis protein CcmH